MIEKIGEFSPEVIKLLNFDIPAGTAIYIGATNIAHMAREHRKEFYLFYNKIPYIISTADYVRFKRDDGSVEYVKLFGKYLKIAVRIAGDGEYYARSIYFIETNRVENLVKKGERKQ